MNIKYYKLILKIIIYLNKLFDFSRFIFTILLIISKNKKYLK